MIQIRKSDDRGSFDFGWLQTAHSFSFGDYYDPKHMGFRSLRVINEDHVQNNKGFGTHPHRDMEIITYVLAGTLEHKDSMGNGSLIRPGEVQRMTAGTGVTHSEFNPANEPVHLLQIWILPEKQNLTPSYEQKTFPVKLNQLQCIASHDAREGSVLVHQDVLLFRAQLEKSQSVTYPLNSNRYAWLQVAEGEVKLNGTTLKAGDGAQVSDEKNLTLEGVDSHSQVLLFDLN